MLKTLLAALTIGIISLLFWATDPLFLPLGWGIIAAVAVWDTRRKLKPGGRAAPPRR